MRGRPPLTPNHFSINTVRGIAMYAVLAYARWVRMNLIGEEVGDADGGRCRWRGFVDAPEVRAMLDRRLDPTIDPTRTVRSVYGSQLPPLASLDRRWVEAKLPEIFPADEDHAYLRDAAWDAYVVHARPFGSVFQLLREEYARAVERLVGRSPVDPAKRKRPDPEEALAERLMILYWRGTLRFEEPDRLLERFYALAPDELRAHAASFVGRVLAREDDSNETLVRLQDLWNRRLASAGETNGKFMTSELGAFGWWFLSGKFDEELALTYLARALNLGGDVGQNVYSVVGRLADAAPRRPRPVIECLDKIVRKILAGDPGSWWSVLAIENDLVRALLAAGDADPETRQAAHGLANVLASYGYQSFRALL